MVGTTPICFPVVFGLVFLNLLTLSLSAETLKESRQKFLKAESLKETGFRTDPANISSIFNQLLRDILQDEPEMAAQLVFHTNQLILREIEQRGSFKPLRNGDNYIAKFLENYEGQTPSIAPIGVMVRTYRRDHSGQIPFEGFGTDAQQFNFLSHFLSLGGNYQTTPAIESMVRDLRQVCGEGRAVFLTPYFFNFVYQLRPAQRSALAKWATDAGRHPDLLVSDYGSSIHLAIAMFERAEGSIVANQSLWRGAELDNRLIEVLQDSAISTAWKAGFTALMGKHFRMEMSPALRIEIGRNLTSVLENKIPFSGRSFKYSIAAFLRGDDKDIAWCTQGIDLLKAWEIRTSKGETDESVTFSPGADWIIPMMELLCRVGTELEISLHFKKYCFQDLVFPGLWINLIKSGQFSLANEAFSQFGALSEYSPISFQVDTTFDKKLAEAIPAYLPSIKDEKDRIFAELLLAAIGDPDRHGPQTTGSTLQSRLDEFVKKHPVLPGWVGDQEMRALEILTLSQRNSAIKKLLEERQTGFENRIEQEENRYHPYWAARIEMHSALEEMEIGQNFPIELWWGRVVMDKNQTIVRQQGYLAKSILIVMDERMADACQSCDIERLRKFLPISRSILQFVPDFILPIYLRQFAVSSLTAHAMCDNMGDWDLWWQSLDAMRRKHLVSILLPRTDEPFEEEESCHLVGSIKTLTSAKSIGAAQPQIAPEIGRRVCMNVFGSALIDEGYQGFSTLANAVSRGLISEKDMSEIAEAIARKAPRNGSSWREFLGIFSDQNHLLETLHLLENEISSTDPSLPLMNSLRIERLEILKALGPKNRAEDSLSKFQNTHFDLPREYQTIIQNLEKR